MNTGYKEWSTLEEYNQSNGVATGTTKPNDPTDPNYVQPVLDTSMCPAPTDEVVVASKPYSEDLYHLEITELSCSYPSISESVGILKGISFYLDGQRYLGGTYWQDYTRYGHNMRLYNMTHANGYFQGAMGFNGTGFGIIDNNLADELDFSREQTIIMLVRVGTLSIRRNPYNQAYGGHGTITQEINGNWAYIWGTHGGDGGPYGALTGPSVVASEKCMIAFTRSPTTITSYKNGIQFSSMSNSYPTTVNNSSNKIIIGTGYTNPYSGNIGLVKVFNRCLTSAEIFSEYNTFSNRI